MRRPPALNIPAAITEVEREHLVEHLSTGTLAFTGTNGAALRRGNFNQLVKWRRTVADLEGLRFDRSVR